MRQRLQGLPLATSRGREAARPRDRETGKTDAEKSKGAGLRDVRCEQHHIDLSAGTDNRS
jgi:hypothetical protein